MDSLMAQDYPNISRFVRDNCSDDGTHSLLKRWHENYPFKIHLFSSETNVGALGNFSKLTEEAQESYIMYCDGDDVWLPNKVSSTMVRMLELEKVHEASVPLLVHTDLAVVDNHLQPISPSFWKYSGLKTGANYRKLSRLLVQNHVTGCTMLLNKALLDLVRPIPEDCVMHDWWIALVAVTMGKIDILPHATLLYRQHSSNDTGAKHYKVFSGRKRPHRPEKLKKQKTNQAMWLLQRFREKLKPEQHKVIQAYLSMQESSLPMRIYLMLRHKFLKTGFLRNLILNH